MIHLPHLETDVTVACQLSCVACNHHVALYRGAGQVWQSEPRQVERDLGLLSRIAHADAWAAIGGEPLLHRQLLDILHVARASGVADRVEVWTNGLKLAEQPREFWRSLDVLVLSAYPGHASDAGVAWARARCADEGVDFQLKDERNRPNFRTLFEPQPTDAEETRAKFRGCFFRSYSRVVDRGYFFTCCCAPHMPGLIQGRPFGTDGVAIELLTEEGLRAYLDRTEPLAACRVCAGRDTALPIVWREERDPVRWVVASAGGTP